MNFLLKSRAYIVESVEAQRWLDHLIKSRISPALTVLYHQNESCIFVRGSDKRINFDHRNLNSADLNILSSMFSGPVDALVQDLSNFSDITQEEFLTDVFQKNCSGVTINFDVIACIFYFLSRQEELENSVKDSNDRFPGFACRAFKDGYLDRPIVDEWIDYLTKVAKYLWPDLVVNTFVGTNLVTCDVDNPYEFYTASFPSFLKKLGGDLLKRKSLTEFNTTFVNYLQTRFNNYSHDLNNTFDWIMDRNEQVGNKVTFFFLVDKSETKFDSHYSVDEPRIRALMRRIHDRDHEIGLHASYGTFKNPTQMKKEADKLRQVMNEEGIKQDEIGSRQHYLRWSTPETARHLEAAGIAYDSTLGYADRAGFRCGTCHEYPMFDIERKKILNLRQRPLILMEASVLSQKYMNLGYSNDALEYMKSLKATCHGYGGIFTLLWHNSHLRTENDRRFYQQLIG